MSPQKTPKRSLLSSWLKPLVLTVSSFLLLMAGVEIFNLGWGSGHLLGKLSAKWLLTLAIYLLFAAMFLMLGNSALNNPKKLKRLHGDLLAWREKLGKWTWLVVFLVAAFPAFFIFYSPWGGLFTGFFTRLLLFLLGTSATTILIALKKESLFSWPALLLANLFVGGLLVLAESFMLVSNYPFALHWSEGNRMWDYSVLFGRARYNYPVDLPIFVWIDPIRQALWGIPFFFSSIPIWLARLWSATLTTIPYALLGWSSFRFVRSQKWYWFAAGLWSLIFLNQGPIYTPLVLAAILVVTACKRPLWIALPLVFLAGHYAASGRFTWAFAPSIWAIMLTFGDGVLSNQALSKNQWLRAGLLAVAGSWTKGLPIALGVLGSVVRGNTTAPITTGTPGIQDVTTLQGLQAVASSQPYLWDRLLPNETYVPGIVIGLLLATAPAVLLLFYLWRNKHWRAEFWQRYFILSGSLAFLIVGLIASVKVGGGADLHNMDMLLVTIVIVAGVAWDGGLYKQLPKLIQANQTLRWIFVAIVIIPSLGPALAGKPLQLPTEERTQFVLQRIQQKVECASKHGPVLFMDQRHLITFGHMGNLPLVVEYEKKFVMDQALANNENYFSQFDSDLAAERFSLIVSDREGTLYKELDQESIGDSLIEENNAWVRWVSLPLLTYYESVGNYKDVAVELFMPIERSFDCP